MDRPSKELRWTEGGGRDSVLKDQDMVMADAFLAQKRSEGWVIDNVQATTANGWHYTAWVLFKDEPVVAPPLASAPRYSAITPTMTPGGDASAPRLSTIQPMGGAEQYQQPGGYYQAPPPSHAPPPSTRAPTGAPREARGFFGNRK